MTNVEKGVGVDSPPFLRRVVWSNQNVLKPKGVPKRGGGKPKSPVKNLSLGLGVRG